MLILSGWILIAAGLTLTIIFTVTAYKGKLPNEIKELKMIQSSGYTSEHNPQHRNTIYRERKVQDSNIPKRERTVSVSARELLKEVEAEREQERNAARKQNNIEKETIASADVINSNNKGFPAKREKQQGTDILRTDNVGLQVSAGTDVLIIGNHSDDVTEPLNMDQVSTPEYKVPHQLEQPKDAGTDILITDEHACTYQTEPLNEFRESDIEEGTAVLADAANCKHSNIDEQYDKLCDETIEHNQETDILSDEQGTDILRDENEQETDILAEEDSGENTDILRPARSEERTEVLNHNSNNLEECTEILSEGTDILSDGSSNIL